MPTRERPAPTFDLGRGLIPESVGANMTGRPGACLHRARGTWCRGPPTRRAGRSDVQDRATELLPADAAGEDAVDGAYQDVRDRVQALIGAARDLSGTCADLADALRPLPGHDDPGGHDFGRLRAERTAALL